MTDEAAIFPVPRDSVPRNKASVFLAVLALLALIGDAVAIFLGLAVAYWLRFKSGWITFGMELANPPRMREYLGLFFMGAVCLLGLLTYVGAYNHNHLLRFRRTLVLVLRAVCLWFVVYLGTSLALKVTPSISRIYAALSAISCTATLVSWRILLHLIAQYPLIAPRLRQKILFVGWNAETTKLFNSIWTDLSHPYEMVGCVPSAEARFAVKPPLGVVVRGDYNDLPQLLKERVCDIVVVADLDPRMGEMVALANLCDRFFVQFKVIPSYFQILVSGLELDTISGVPVLGVSRLPLDRLSNRAIKRTIDIAGALVGLIASLPIWVWCAWRIRREDPGSVFFGQERIGRSGRPFTMWKLRSMKLGSEKTDHVNQSTLRDDPRVLPVGVIMRRWNLDETPQFWNVLKGNMSLVGPRPERTYHSDRLSEQIPHYNARYTAKPGITGWAQIHGLRGDTDLNVRVQYDFYYLENWSPLLDLQIMAMTFFRRDNAY
ncbi:MAG: exopolysaccharide biosynthesis polyprenyl glycosylphosphotransferase [Limisphaerales bacterium]